ncbi:MAG: 7-cyano-7-deazaguanine synthase QueC [Deltaproteobacteria bacterium]|nr:7-cyano-7-deazaguanine synthase QueC [Deltaproteobacteria bacterium]
MHNKEKENLSVVLTSGGLDSALTATIAKQEGDLALLHANYGQRTEARELKSFHDLADHLGAKERLVIDLSFLKVIGGSALTDDEIEVPLGDIKSKEIPITYVPFRNAHFLSAGISWAEVLGASSVFIGAVEEDGSGYPDCRDAFFDSFEESASLGTRPETKILIKRPLIKMRKKDIVELGLRINAPFHLTWSCYKDSLLACGECDSCLLRLRGFEEAGVGDKIKYKKTIRG